MKLKCVLSLTPLLLLIAPAAQASEMSGTFLGTNGITYTYYAQFSTQVLLCRLTGPGTITANADYGDVETSTSGEVQAQASLPYDQAASCTFSYPGGTSSVPLTNN